MGVMVDLVRTSHAARSMARAFGAGVRVAPAAGVTGSPYTLTLSVVMSMMVLFVCLLPSQSEVMNCSARSNAEMRSLILSFVASLSTGNRPVRAKARTELAPP